MLRLVMGNKNYSSWSLRAWLGLRMSGLAFEETVIPMDGETWERERGSRAPSGLVPCLHDGDLEIWESLAILEYVAEKAPEARLWPADPAARAVARAVSCEMHAGFRALRSAMPMNVRHSLPGRGREPGVEADIARITEIWRDCRQRFGRSGALDEAPFLFGEFSAADAMFAPVASRFTTYEVELDPVSRNYVAAVMALPAMAEWIEAARAEPWIIEHEELA